ncbi:MAG: hypothetical protein AB1938_00870 [Myxococcota bacterium]
MKAETARLRRWWLMACVWLMTGGCSPGGDVCPPKEGKIACGYCAEDALLSSNPNAGMCVYCPAETTCSTTDACDTGLQCLGGGGSGGGSGSCVPTGCPTSTPWLGCGSCWPSASSCHSRGTTNLSDDCTTCRKCP